MAIEKLNFKSSTGLASVFEAEAKTALEMVGLMSNKVDECVELVNGVEQSAIEARAIVDTMKEQQDAIVQDLAETVIPTTTETYIDAKITDGTISEMIDTQLVTPFNVRLTQAEADITALETSTETHTTDISALDTRLDNAETDITALETLTGTHTTDISALDTRLDNAETDINSLETLTGTHTTDISALDTRLDNAETDIQQIMTDLPSLVHTESVNIKEFGALCNGISNDAPAIHAALSSGATKIILPFNTTINTPINCTNRVDKPIKFIGEGMSQNEVTARVNCNTGGIAFDFTGSQFVEMEDLLLYGNSGLSNPSKVGILIARSTTSGYAQFHSYKRVTVFLGSDPSYSGRGTIGLLNISGEHLNVEHSFFIADLPIAIMDTNKLNINSPYVSYGNIVSSSFMSFKQVAMRAFKKSSVEIWGAYIVDFDDCYFGGLSIAGIPAITVNSGCSTLKFKGMIESFVYAIQLNGDVTDLQTELYIDGEAISPLVNFEGSYHIYNPRLIIRQMNGTIQTLFSTQNTPYLHGGQVTVFIGQTVNLSALTVYGTDFNLAGVTASAIVVNSASQFTLNGSDIITHAKGDNGYVKYTNGIVEQWLKVNYNQTADTDLSITFPIAFKTAVNSVQLTAIGSASVNVTENGRTLTGATIRCSSGSATIYVRVLGN